MRMIAAIGILAATASLAVPSMAQDYMPSFSNGTLMQDMSRNSMYSLQQQRRQGGRSEAQRSPVAGASSAAGRPATRIATTYDASPAVTSRVKQQFVAFMEDKVGPDGAQQMRSVLDNGDPVASWAGIVRSDGLRPGDLVDAMTAYWMLNWVMANQSDNNRGQMMAARDQVRGLISNASTASSLDNAERQEMSEAMMLNFLVQHAAYSDAMQRGDRAMMRRLGDAAVTRFRNEMGVDLRQLRLTDQGFVPGA